MTLIKEIKREKKEKKMNAYKIIQKIENKIDYVFETATNDEGMNAKEKVNFHSFNSNGYLVILRELGWKGYDCGLTSGAFATTYYNEALTKLQGQKKPRYISINVLVEMMNKDIKRWEEKIAKCEGK